MKRLVFFTLALVIIASGTFWFLSEDRELDPAMLDQFKRGSKYAQALARAEQGDARAQHAVARMLASGDGVKKDMRAAVKWHLNAADQAYGPSQYDLGMLYYSGAGVRQNYATAAKWFRLAATFNNHAESQYQLGEMHFNGRGVEHDYAQAITYYTQAAGQGHPAAQYILGTMHIEGWGVKRDLVTAYMWLTLANAHRDAAMAKNKRYDPAAKLATLSRKMNQFQIDQAHKRLAEMARKP